MEAELAFEPVGLGGECDALLGDYGIEFGESVERAIDDGFVDKDPERFGGLKLRRIGRQKGQPDALWDGKIGRSMPTGVVENDNDDLVRPRSRFPGKQRQEFFEQAFRDAVRQVEETVPGLWGDECRDVQPFVAMTGNGDRSLADRRPDAARDWLEADAMLVARKRLDHRIRVTSLLVFDDRREVFLKAS